MAVQINVLGQYNGRELEKALKDLQKLKSQAQKAGTGIGGALQQAGTKVQSFGQATANAGDQMTKGVTVPVLAAGGAFLKLSTDMNTGMANVASLGVATDRVEELKSGVQDLAVEVGKSTDDLTGGLYNVVSAFGDSSDSMKILETNARAATAGLATTTDAINLTSAVTKGYGDTSAEAVQKASDLALKAVQLGQTTFPELAASVGKVIPLTSALSVSQEELFGVMATFTGVTGGAAEVSTQLRGVMQGLMQPTADMAALLEDVGVESGKALVEQEGLQGAMKIITDAAAESGKPLGKYLSSIEAQTLAMAAAGGQADVLTEKTAAMGEAAGATDEAFKAQTEGVNAAGFQMKQAQQEAIVLGQRLGDTLAPMLIDVFDAAKPLVAKVEEAVDWFTSLDEAQQRQIVQWVAIVAAMGPVLSITGRLLKPVGSLIKVTGKATTGVGHLGRAFGKNAADAPKWAQKVAGASKAVGRGMASAAKATATGAANAARALASWIAAGARWVAAQLAQAAKALASMAATAAKFVAHYARMAAAALANAARMAASWVIAMGPVGWVIAAVVALVALIIANWDKVKRWTKAAWDWVGDKIAAVWSWIKTTTTNAINAVVGFVTGLRDRVVGTVRDLWGRVVQFFRNLKADAIAIVGALVTGYVNLILNLRERALGIVRSIRDRVVGFVTDLRDGAVAKARDLYEGIKGHLESVVSFITGMPSKIANAASGMWDGILTAFRSAINTIIRGWNAIEFRIPGFKVGPIGYDGFTLGVPDIPMLAQGAIATGATLAMIGEGSQDEAVIPLPSDWRRGDSGPLGGTSMTFRAPLVELTIKAGSGSDAREIGRVARREVEDALRDVLDEVLAGAGAA